MGGVAVSDGATLSTTGEMQVSCNVPYTLTADGVPWVPISSDGGVDTYLLSTSAVIRIFSEGTRLLTFSNVLSLDFVLQQANYTFMDADNNDLASGYVSRQYLQLPFVANTASCKVLALATDTSIDLTALGATCTQGNITRIEQSPTSHFARVDVANIDPSQYLAIFIGNVLVAFFEPIS